jgi:predicted Zn-dependent protease
LSPNFQEAGFTRPDQVVLIENGSCHDFLTSPRSAAEYAVSCNGASLRESPQSVEMPAGSLDLDRIPAEIGTGLYVNNLHYLNYSDRSGCRMTGLTRFATLWVENGRVQGPVAVGRFDETLYRMLGVNLVALTKEREWILDPQTYGRRSTDSARLPGALIDDFRFTL